MLMQKLLLTGAPARPAPSRRSRPRVLMEPVCKGLLIFIKPNTTSQLATGFVISGFFYVLHVKTSAYANDTQDELQFCSMLSITLTLFGGILLRTNTQDEDPAGLFMMTFLLIVINVGVILLFAYQTYKGLTAPPPEEPSLLDAAKQVAMEAAIAESKKHVASAIELLGYEPDEAKALLAQCLEMMDQLVLAMAAMEDCQDILDDLYDAASGGKTSPGEVLDKFIGVSKKVLGKPKTIKLFTPVTGTLLAGVATGMQAAGCDKETTDKLEGQAAALSGFICKYGVVEFFEKWKQDVIDKIFGKVKDMLKLDEAGRPAKSNPNPNLNLNGKVGKTAETLVKEIMAVFSVDIEDDLNDLI